jgi:hypothetical protein
MRRNRFRIGVENLEGRFALSAFGELVADQAHDPQATVGTATFGEHQSDFAHDVDGDGVKGLGEFNRNGGPLTDLKQSN